MTVAMYTGSFDPVTLGHLDIATRASAIYDEVVVGIGPRSSALFSLDERIALWEKAAAHLDNVRIASITGLTVDAARNAGATVLVRGLRDITDFTYEFDMAMMNRRMAPEVDSVFLMTELSYLIVSATRMRELASLGRDVSEFVPPGVNEALAKKFAANA